MKIDIIGDIHGCLHEFEQLTKQLGLFLGKWRSYSSRWSNSWLCW